jgi:hypothetical protein
VLFQNVGFAVPAPSPQRFWDGLLYATRSILSLSDSEIGLTRWGKLLQLALRLVGPVLLALALLSVRNRVKR